jgi:hypothetical protein
VRVIARPSIIDLGFAVISDDLWWELRLDEVRAYLDTTS